MVWIIGAGYMAKEYCKVLQSLDEPFTVVGRGQESARTFEEETGAPVITGGAQAAIQGREKVPGKAIVCCTVNNLAETSILLMSAGVNQILIEKPGALSRKELEAIIQVADKQSAHAVIGYNRRFYQSVLAAERLMREEGGPTAVHFEITEWAHLVAEDPSPPQVKTKWILANTSHVIDLAFFLAGAPQELESFTSGKLSWHPAASRFSGAGKTEKGVLFNYFGCWDGPGRWALEFATVKNRYLFKPMEKLSVQALGSVEVADVEGLDYRLDQDFKPGLYLQTRAFLEGNFERFCTLSEQKAAFAWYQKMGNYQDV